jgi:hypothetical protein
VTGYEINEKDRLKIPNISEDRNIIIKTEDIL